ncbi:MAG: ATP-dependent helicase, partial [Gammaproteobacteria bacterium]|nr:ATP-dependent helicase [Gammaproteobacteria bacterium]
GFEPVHELPASRLDTRPIKPKKPKKPKPGHRDGQRSGENARGHKPKGKNTRHRSSPYKGAGNSNRSGNRNSR